MLFVKYLKKYKIRGIFNWSNLLWFSINKLIMHFQKQSCLKKKKVKANKQGNYFVNVHRPLSRRYRQQRNHLVKRIVENDEFSTENRMKWNFDLTRQWGELGIHCNWLLNHESLKNPLSMPVLCYSLKKASS